MHQRAPNRPTVLAGDRSGRLFHSATQVDFQRGAFRVLLVGPNGVRIEVRVAFCAAPGRDGEVGMIVGDLDQVVHSLYAGTAVFYLGAERAASHDVHSVFRVVVRVDEVRAALVDVTM